MLKKIFIITVLFFLIAAGVVWYIIYRQPTGLENKINTETGTYDPFGGLSPNRTSSPEASPTPTGGVAFNPTTQSLVKLSNEQIVGLTFVENGSSTLIRLMNRANAHINDINPTNGLLTRITNTTIPRIQEVAWFNNGNSAFMRFLADDGETIKTYNASVKIKTSTSTEIVRELQGTFTTDNIEVLALSPKKNQFFSLIRTEKGEGYTSNVDGSARKQVLNSPFTEWMAQWPQESSVMLTTKASAGVEGYTYSLNPKTGGLTKVLGNVRGLTTLADSSATRLAYTNHLNELSVLNTKTGNTVSTLLRTIAEKCVWSNRSATTIFCAIPETINASRNYPDSWYQGITSFSDNIYKINTESGFSEMVGNITGNFKQQIDAVDLSLSSNDNYLIFRNKKDNTPWAYILGTSTTP